MGASGGATVTDAEHVVCPPGPETVSVYLVEAVSETDFEPPLADTEPTPLSIDALVTAEVLQESVVEPPP